MKQTENQNKAPATFKACKSAIELLVKNHGDINTNTETLLHNLKKFISEHKKFIHYGRGMDSVLDDKLSKIISKRKLEDKDDVLMLLTFNTPSTLYKKIIKSTDMNWIKTDDFLGVNLTNKGAIDKASDLQTAKANFDAAPSVENLAKYQSILEQTRMSSEVKIDTLLSQTINYVYQSGGAQKDALVDFMAQHLHSSNLYEALDNNLVNLESLSITKKAIFDKAIELEIEKEKPRLLVLETIFRRYPEKELSHDLLSKLDQSKLKTDNMLEYPMLFLAVSQNQVKAKQELYTAILNNTGSKELNFTSNAGPKHSFDTIMQDAQLLHNLNCYANKGSGQTPSSVINLLEKCSALIIENQLPDEKLG